MPPKQASSTAPRGRPPASKKKAPAASSRQVNAAANDDENEPTRATPSAKAKGKQRARDNSAEPMEIEDEQRGGEDEQEQVIDEGLSDDEDDPPLNIPPALLTRILHEFFEKEGTRVTSDANEAVARYMDVFVKEAIARAAAERGKGFLEVSSTIFSLQEEKRERRGLLTDAYG